MKSKTLHPFRTTNLVVVRATNGASGSSCSDFFACGDALLLDPGCSSQVHAEVKEISSDCVLVKENKWIFVKYHLSCELVFLPGLVCFSYPSRLL
jgi:hypothetical protein